MRSPILPFLLFMTMKSKPIFATVSSTYYTNHRLPSKTSNVKQEIPSTIHDTVSIQKGIRGGGSITKIREALFPIHGEREVTKFLLIGSIKFFIVMALTLTRDMKDTLVVTQCGAEAIAFLKIYGVLPAATAFIAIYSKLASILDKKTLFYTTCIPFFIFFILFDTIIFPSASLIQPSYSSIHSFLNIGGGSGGATDIIAKILTNWTSALYYILAEIYSSVSVGLLFWQFANDIVTIQEAKRFYPLFAQMSAFAPIVAGQYMVRFASKAKDFPSSLHRNTIAVSCSGMLACLFYHLSNSFVEKDHADDAPIQTGQPSKKKAKPKMSLVESAKFLASSEYLRMIATLVIGYGLTINFTEVTWKSLVKRQYPDPLQYQRFMGNFSSAVGIATVIVIFLGVHIIRILGWRIGALATPSIMAILGIPFFTCIFLGLDSPERLRFAVVLGTVQSLLSKTGKYALFDPTTQMAYIPLDQESKVKGKAAIDVLGSRLGKSGGSFLQQGMVLFFGNILDAAPVVAVVFYTVLVGWMLAANRLNGLFLEKTRVDGAKVE